MDVLLELLDELLAGGVDDAEDALEVAIHAGLASRLGAPTTSLAEALAWRDGVGAAYLEEIWAELELEPFVEVIDGIGPDDEEEAVEDALYDFDDVVAAALWCSRRDAVIGSARKIAAIIRQVPDPFAQAGSAGAEMASLPPVARDLELYDYWFATADAAAWLDAEGEA